MEEPFGLSLADNGFQAWRIEQVGGMELSGLGEIGECGRPGRIAAHPRQRMTTRGHQRLHEVPADEPGDAGDQDTHFAKPKAAQIPRALKSGPAPPWRRARSALTIRSTSCSKLTSGFQPSLAR